MSDTGHCKTGRMAMLTWPNPTLKLVYECEPMLLFRAKFKFDRCILSLNQAVATCNVQKIWTCFFRYMSGWTDIDTLIAIRQSHIRGKVKFYRCWFFRTGLLQDIFWIALLNYESFGPLYSASILWSHMMKKDNASNIARCTRARKTTHGLDGQHRRGLSEWCRT